MDAATLGAVASIITAVGILVNAIVSGMTLLQGRKNGAVAAETRSTLERVETNSNGHLALLTSMVGAVDPAIAAEAAAKVLKTAEDAARNPPP